MQGAQVALLVADGRGPPVRLDKNIKMFGFVARLEIELGISPRFSEGTNH
jgi:hypothetical protein